MQDERGGRAGEVQLGELRRPRREPRRQVRPAADASCASGVMAQHLAQIGLENRAAAPASWSARPVRCCSSLTAFSVCRMLSAAESTWLLRKSGSCRLTAISASAWILPSMRSSSIDDELGVLLRAAEVVEAQLAHRDAVLQRPDDALVAAAALRRREALAQLLEPRR